MSMLNSQVEEMRNAAMTYRMLGRHTLANVLLEAANSITELRGALQVASVDYRHLPEENAKLCELVRWMYVSMDESCAVQHPYAPAPISYDLLMQAAARAHELGIEVRV